MSQVGEEVGRREEDNVKGLSKKTQLHYISKRNTNLRIISEITYLGGIWTAVNLHIRASSSKILIQRKECYYDNVKTLNSLQNILS